MFLEGPEFILSFILERLDLGVQLGLFGFLEDVSPPLQKAFSVGYSSGLKMPSVHSFACFISLTVGGSWRTWIKVARERGEHANSEKPLTPRNFDGVRQQS